MAPRSQLVLQLLSFAAVVVVARGAVAEEAFPWNGTVTLTDSKGHTLSWTVARSGDEVRITGSHPKWAVEHRARPDGTPVSTTRRADGTTTTVTYSAAGATFERQQKDGTLRTERITTRGLWDSDTLEARLAGIAWAPGKRLKFSAIDTGSDDGTVYPLVAEYVGLAQCGPASCHHVRVSLDGWRRPLGPTFDYRFGTGAGAPYLQHTSDGTTWSAR